MRIKCDKKNEKPRIRDIEVLVRRYIYVCMYVYIYIYIWNPIRRRCVYVCVCVCVYIWNLFFTNPIENSKEAISKEIMGRTFPN